MDRVERYRALARQAICDFAAQIPSQDAIEDKIVFQEEIGYYALMDLGWDGPSRVYGNILHFDVKDGKIWIQHDGTEDGIVDFFLENGVPKTDIVLGFRAPELRQYTDFAIA